jgi:RND family efflux transporter MFP subunit
MFLLGATTGQAAEPLMEGLVVPFRQVEVSAPVSSFIVEMQVKEGDRVKAGQLLAHLYGKLDELELKRAKALLERREFEAQGVKRLFDSRIIPEAKALEARIELDLARLNFETATEQVRLRSLVAPIDGVVVERYREVGEAVQAFQRIYRIVDLSKVFIVCALKPDQLAHTALGQRRSVSFPEWQAVTPLQAEVVFFDPCVDASGFIRMKLLLDNPGGHLHGGIKALVEGPEEEAHPHLPAPAKTR